MARHASSSASDALHAATAPPTLLHGSSCASHLRPSKGCSSGCGRSPRGPYEPQDCLSPALFYGRLFQDQDPRNHLEYTGASFKIINCCRLRTRPSTSLTTLSICRTSTAWQRPTRGLASWTSTRSLKQGSKWVRTIGERLRVRWSAFSCDNGSLILTVTRQRQEQR